MQDVKANRVESFGEMKSPGDFLWTHQGENPDSPIRGLVFRCPCGCGAVPGVSVTGDPTKTPVWDWDGNLDSPTITPSIRILDRCCWHGYLTAGVFKTC